MTKNRGGDVPQSTNKTSVQTGKCVLCFGTLHGAGYEVRHMASQHVAGLKTTILQRWDNRTSCPVCGIFLFDVRNKRVHLDNHKPIEIARGALEIIFSAKPLIERDPVSQRVNGLDYYFSGHKNGKSSLDDFFW